MALKYAKGTLQLVYIAAVLLMLTTAVGLLWLNLLNQFLKQAGNEIPMAGPLSVVLALLMISTCVHLVRKARHHVAAVAGEIRTE